MKTALALSFLLFSSAAIAADTSSVPYESLAQRFADDVKILASDATEGRGIGTKGIEIAAKFIEGELKSLHLQPAFDGSYRQTFPIKTGVVMKSGNSIDGVQSQDWTPLGFSSSGKFSGELAFVGYGIDAPAVGYSDYGIAGLQGKVAVMLRYEPQERDEASPFDGRRPSRWSSLRYKVLQARERGAVAVIFVTGPLQDEDKDKLPVLRNDGPESPAGLPVLQVKRSVAQKWLGPAGVDLAAFQKSVDRDLTPRSNFSTGVRISGTVALDESYVTSSNLAGILPGKGALAGEVVVIGAHYDHLGYGGEHSMKPNVHAIHNGADDNASGTAAVLLAAQRVQELLASSTNHRTVLFALFSGEEVGLAGSGYLVAHPPLPIARTVAMVNLDMVGDLRDDQLAALGADSAPEWPALVQRLATEVGIKANTRGDGYGPSDQTSFYAMHIPVIHLFTGTHERYHTPEDDPDTLNNAGAAHVVELTARLGAALAAGEVTPHYARASALPAMEGDSRGYGAYLGTVPDYRAMEAESGGVLLSDVRPGGPADLAGIRGGDRITRMAGTKIENLYDMSFALQDHKPGETIEVEVIRNGSPLTMRATLGSRSQRGEPGDSKSTPAGPHTIAPETNSVPSGPVATITVSTPAPAASPKPAFELPEFYRNRPGHDFTIAAGKPYNGTFEGERHFSAVRQLTFGGENAEAYFSPDGKKLIYQATVEGAQCDQQYVLDLATGATTRVSDGKGRTTCGYFDYPEADRIVYASTEGGGDACPAPPDRSHGYVWAVYDTYDIYEARPDGSEKKKLTSSAGYDAEATWCHRGGKLVFTSDRDGDLDLYEMNEAGDLRRLTNTPGYDGGAFYSPDCSEIVWRASRPEGKSLEEYRQLLAKNLVHPTEMELFVMNSDGTHQRQLTSNGAANFCPYFLPDGQRIIYSSNAGADPREFDLWMIDKAGGQAERITTAPGFDGFPMFSPDGEFIVWASNRADVASHQTNLFIARWVP